MLPFVVSLSNHERMPPTRSVAARGQSLLAIAPKVTKNSSPCTPLHPAVLATIGMRQRHTKASLTLRTVCARGRIYDRPLLRSSARLKGLFDRNLIAARFGLQEPECEHPGCVG